MDRLRALLTFALTLFSSQPCLGTAGNLFSVPAHIGPFVSKLLNTAYDYREQLDSIEYLKSIAGKLGFEGHELEVLTGSLNSLGELATSEVRGQGKKIYVLEESQREAMWELLTDVRRILLPRFFHSPNMIQAGKDHPYIYPVKLREQQIVDPTNHEYLMTLLGDETHRDITTNRHQIVESALEIARAILFSDFDDDLVTEMLEAFRPNSKWSPYPMVTEKAIQYYRHRKNKPEKIIELVNGITDSALKGMEFDVARDVR